MTRAPGFPHPRFALFYLTAKAKVADLDAMLQEIGTWQPTEDHADPAKMNAGQKRALIETARRRYWDDYNAGDRGPDVAAPRRSRSTPRISDGITAADCNAWLATLPRVPHV